MSTGWWIGWGVGLVVVALVVVLLLLMIRGASRAVVKAGNILDALRDARDNSSPLWEVDTTNRTAERITQAATAARQHLEAKGA